MVQGKWSTADVFETAERSQVDPPVTLCTASELLTAVFMILLRSFKVYILHEIRVNTHKLSSRKALVIY